VTAAKHEGTALADELLHRLGQAVGRGATVSTVFGEAVERDGITVIPVAKARFGFGGGGGAGGRGSADGSGGGGGGGAIVSPAGFIELGHGTARFKRISGPFERVALVMAASLVVFAVTRVIVE
jgi:uncharacterized spore protein YtfJ